MILALESGCTPGPITSGPPSDRADASPSCTQRRRRLGGGRICGKSHFRPSIPPSLVGLIPLLLPPPGYLTRWGLPPLIPSCLGGLEPLQAWEILPAISLAPLLPDRYPPTRSFMPAPSPLTIPPDIMDPGFVPGVVDPLATFSARSDRRDYLGFTPVGWPGSGWFEILGLFIPSNFAVVPRGHPQHLNPKFPARRSLRICQNLPISLHQLPAASTPSRAHTASKSTPETLQLMDDHSWHVYPVFCAGEPSDAPGMHQLPSIGRVRDRFLLSVRFLPLLLLLFDESLCYSFPGQSIARRSLQILCIDPISRPSLPNLLRPTLRPKRFKYCPADAPNPRTTSPRAHPSIIARSGRLNHLELRVSSGLAGWSTQISPVRFPS